MLNDKIEAIIIKYFTKSVSIPELIKLTEWMSEPSNALIFQDYVKTNYLIDSNMLDFDTEAEKEKILQKIREDEKNIRNNKFKDLLKYAAIFIGAIGLGFFLLTDDFSFTKEQDIITNIKTEIQPGKNKAILTLENGSDIDLENSENLKLTGRSIYGEKLVYDTKAETKNNSIQYNYLAIPKGGQFFVQLSDGTRVWLNSDSKLKYPVNFIRGQARKVELLYGEAYFDVSPSTDHNGDTFQVQTRIQEIEVLGTEFNIKAYQDEKEIVSTLVEGRVKITSGTETNVLRPSEQALLYTGGQSMTIRKVDKLFDEIAWKDGYFSFKHKSMKDIMKILSRWYDMDYVFKNSEKENKRFTGVLDRESTINEILNYIQKTNEISYEIKNKTVIID
ncbi:FecR family protein [Maribacter polysaccharolyticus]|uniref:FecR family protein n=1 Tax=Maribacter polysaccharolyticus TaxID=3020831 RepID=UPI00237EF342|nr:FecR family protein [Maribacter polysaccharolyticus]MDE3741162.1 DUF4974 domain-containing protein [Maribacter polysaccharolyticus]